METGNLLLNALSPGDLGRLSPHLNNFEVRAGAVLYEPEAEIDWVYFPERGLISVISVMLSGDTAESAVVGREGGVGIVEAAGSGVYLSRALVQANLQALRLPSSRYRDALNASESLRRAVAEHAELSMAEGRQAIACVAHHVADHRLAWWLLECLDRANSGNRLPLTQEFLAAMLGLQRTTVTAVAQQLRDEGLIDYQRGFVTIIDRAGLEAKSCECYATTQHFRALIQGAQARRRGGGVERNAAGNRRRENSRRESGSRQTQSDRTPTLNLGTGRPIADFPRAGTGRDDHVPGVHPG